MEPEPIKYEKYSRDLKRMLIFSGIWPKSNSTVQTIIAFFAIFTLFMTGLTVLNFAMHHINNVMIAVGSIGLLISLSACILKVIKS